MSKLRILVCTDPDTAHSIRFVDSLSKRAEVGLFWFGDKRDLSGYRVPCFPLLLQDSLNFPGVRRVTREFAFYSTIFFFKPDLIHIHRDAWWCKKFKQYAPNIPLVFTSWGHISKSLLLGHWGSHIAYADGLTGDAQTLIDELQEIQGCDEKPSVVFRFGISENTFRPAAASQEIKKELSIPLDGRVVYSPRSLRSIYNHETLIRAIPEILKKVPNTYFIFVNNHGHRYPDSAEYKTSLQKIIDELDIEKNVQFLDHVEEHAKVASRFQMADVIVSIPLEDGFPVTILEAMACGAPLVVSSLPDYNEVVDEKNALSVYPTDVAAVAEAVIKILTSGDDRARLSQAGLKTFEEKGKMDNEIEKLLTFYEQLIEGRK